MFLAAFLTTCLFVTPLAVANNISNPRVTPACSPGFLPFENVGFTSPSTFCITLNPPPVNSEQEGKTWEEANQSCRKMYGFLMDLNSEYYNSTGLVDYFNSRNDLKKIWIGMRRVSGFHIWDTFKSSTLSKSQNWENIWANENEPRLDCVALDVQSWRLVTEECSSILPYACMSEERPSEPIDTPACPADWKFTYHLDASTSGCFRAFSSEKFNDSLHACKSLGGTLFGAEEYNKLYQMLKLNDGAYWPQEQLLKKSNRCTKMEIRLGEIAPRNVSCSKKFPFVCQRSVDKFESQARISHSGDGINALMKCDVTINGGAVPAGLERFLHLRWTKSGIPINEKQSAVPLFVFDATKENLVNGNRQGAYQCSVLIPGQADYVISDEYDAFFSDISTYVVTFKGSRIPYDISQEVSKAAFLNVMESIRQNLMKPIVESAHNIFPSVEWDFLHIEKQSDNVTLRIHLYVNWNESQGIVRPENEENDVYRPLKEMLRRLSAPLNRAFGVDAIEIQSADKCFAEKSFPTPTNQIIWPETFGTKETSSYPLCRNERGELLTRTCKADVYGAKWSAFPDGLLCRPEKHCDTDRATINGLVLTWPSTKVGEFAIPEPLCLTSEREPLARRCLPVSWGNARWSEVNETCSVDPITNITYTLAKLSQVKVNETNVMESTRNLSQLTSRPDSLQPIDLHYVAETMENIASSPSRNSQVIEMVVEAFDNVMLMDAAAIEGMQKMTNSSSRITDSLERIVATSEIQNSSFSLTGRTIALQTIRLVEGDKDLVTGFAVSFPAQQHLYNGSDNFPADTEAGIALPEGLISRYAFNSSKSAEEQRLTFVVYTNTTLFGYEGFQDDITVNSFIIHASAGESAKDLNPPVRMIFKPINDSENLLPFMFCGYWDQGLNDELGGWSTDGCSFEFNETFMCSCDHLTNFALLLSMDPNSSISKEHRLVLNIIAYVGCGLSIFGLAATILTFLLFRKWRKGNKHQTLMNLSVALISLLVVFVVGVDRKDHKVGCMIVAVLLHYFLLASFAWMMVEAVIQYLNFVKVMSTYIPRFMKKAMIFAWGFPVLIIALVLIFNFNAYYGRKNSCWISHSAFTYSVAIPIGMFLLVNVIVFCLIIYSITCQRQKGLRCNQDERQQAITRLRASICIFFLLGLSWMFGFLAVDKAQPVFQYLFSITATLQGFLIFIFCVIQEKAARELWRNLLCPWSNAGGRSQTSHSTGGVSMSHASNGKLTF